MAKTKKISLKPILVLVQKTKKDLEKGKKFAAAPADKKLLDSRIKALDKVEALISNACKHGSVPPLSVVVPSGT